MTTKFLLKLHCGRPNHHIVSASSGHIVLLPQPLPPKRTTTGIINAASWRAQHTNVGFGMRWEMSRVLDKHYCSLCCCTVVVRPAILCFLISWTFSVVLSWTTTRRHLQTLIASLTAPQHLQLLHLAVHFQVHQQALRSLHCSSSQWLSSAL